MGYTLPTVLYINSADYEFNCWAYSSSSTSAVTFSPKKEYDSNPVIISPKNSSTYFRIGVRRKDGVNMASSDITALTTAVKTFALTDKTLSLTGVPADAKAVSDVIDNIKIRMTEKRYLFDGLPFYEIGSPFTEERLSYKLENNQWVEGSVKQSATEIIHCPRYLMVHWKDPDVGIFIYIGDLVSGEFVPDENALFYVTSKGVINYISGAQGFSTYETDGTKYMWIGVLSGPVAEKGYEDYVTIIGADTWPKSPLKPNAWSYYSGNTSREITNSSTTEAGYYLPEESWIFVKDVQNSRILYGNNNTTSSKPWSVFRPKVSAFYVPKDAGMPMLTVLQSDVITEENLCIVPRILDRCLSSNAVKVEKLVTEIQTKFRYIAKANTANIASGTPMTIGKEYHTIPYSGRWNAHHMACYDTTPETIANAANDEYSVFYDNTSGMLGTNGGAGYGGVCSTFGSLAMGSPYPQTTTGFLADGNFEVQMLDNPRSGDVCLSLTIDEEDQIGHAAFVDEVFDNGYSIYEFAPPGIIQSIHTAHNTVNKANYRVNESYLNSYNFKLSSKDRTGWVTNYFNFDYEIANGSIRPWFGNKSVVSDYDKLSTSIPSTGIHNGIPITVHGGATTAYIKKPSGTIVSVDVTGETVVNIETYCDEVGTYELYSNVSETKEYFRYFEHDPVTLRLAEDGTAVFECNGEEATDIDYAYVWCYGIPTDYPDVPSATVTVIAKGKKYPGTVIREIKCAVVRDTTEVDGEEDSWGRYPVLCTMAM